MGWTACVLGGAIVAIAAALAGCAGAAPPSVGSSLAEPVFVGNQGGAWEVVFLPAEAPLEGAAGPAMARRDAALNVRAAESILEVGMWPEPARPDLFQTRRLFLSTRAGEVLYLPDPAHRYRRWYWR
jgi:hypothetical protein